jgi:hypothetical protein
MRYDLVHFIHTREFDECLADLSMTDEEFRDVQRTLQSNPEAGDAIPGAGGVRKLRAAVKGKGKRGGARVIYFYVTTRQTVYLLLTYDQSETDDISENGKRVLRQLAARLGAEGSAGRVRERDQSAYWQAFQAGGAPQSAVERWRRQAPSPTQQERAGHCGPLGMR